MYRIRPGYAAAAKIAIGGKARADLLSASGVPACADGTHSTGAANTLDLLQQLAYTLWRFRRERL